MEQSINPENKCAHLYRKVEVDNPLKAMFEAQDKLQRFIASKGKAVDIDTATFRQKVDDITIQFRNLTVEFAEMLERLPFKEWKEYSPEQMSGWVSDEQKLETYYEFCDMWLFFINIARLLGINDQVLTNLYFTKNEEVLKRIENNY